MLGLWLGGGVDEGSEVLVWVRAVATAILAGVIAQILVQPPGALASVPDWLRYAAVAAGFAAFLADAAFDPGRRGLRRIRDAGWQMVDRVISVLHGHTRGSDGSGQGNSAKANSPSMTPTPNDAGLVFIGRIRTPWTSREGHAAAGTSRRPGLPARDFRALGAGAEGRRFLHQSRSDLLAAPVAPRSRAAKPEGQPIDPRHVLAALAGAAEPDRHLDRQAGRRRGQRRFSCAGSIASTRRRCSTSSPTAASSSPLAPPQPGDFETE